MGTAMSGLALTSLRHRATAFTATFVAVLLGAAVMGSFAMLIETATGPVSDTDRDALMTMGAVVGSWGAVIVLFAVASTTAITVGQRATEIGLLRTIGARRAQVRRLVLIEVVGVAVVAATLGAVVAAMSGRVLLAALQDGGVVDESVRSASGWTALGATVGVVVVVAMIAARVTAQRATSGPPSVTAVEDRAPRERLRWWRWVLGALLVGYGVGMGVVTITVTADSADPYDAMATSGASSILVGVGLATVAPALLRLLARPVALLMRGPAGHLAGLTTARRAATLGGVLGPVIVLTSASVGTLVLVDIDHRTVQGAPGADTQLVNLLNNVVVAMLSLFAAILVVNAWAAVAAHRRDELRRLWLLGAEPRQVTRTVLLEGTIVGIVGVVLGLLGSLATIVPFSLARDEGLLPDGGWLLPPTMVAVVLVTAIGSAAVGVRRAAPVPVTA